MNLTSQEGSQEVRNAAPNEWLSSDFYRGSLRWVPPDGTLTPSLLSFIRKEVERDPLNDEVVCVQQKLAVVPQVD